MEFYVWTAGVPTAEEYVRELEQGFIQDFSLGEGGNISENANY